MKNIQSNILFLLLTTVLITPAFSQQVMVPKKCYMLLRGNVNKDVTVEMNLIKINDTLLGTCTYSGSRGSAQYPDMAQGKVLYIHGKMSGNAGFTLKENYPWEKGNFFRGSFRTAQTVAGTWENEKGTQKYPFELSEKYPEGSIGMNVYYRKGSTPLVKKPKSPVARIEEVLVMPAESANPIISDTLKKLILEQYSGSEVASPDPDKMLNGMMQVYFENYITSNESIYESNAGMSFAWQSLKSMKVLYNGGYLLSCSIDHYAFTGGAHGLSSRKYFSVDLKTGKQVVLGDLFPDPGSAEMVALLTDRLKEQAGIIRSKKLKDAGYFVDDIKPSDNFYLTPEGIGFLYNPYDIAPYSFGQTEIFLKYSEIKGLLKPESIAHRWLN